MSIRVRVGLGHHFVYDDQTYSGGDELDVPETVALALMRNGMALPADGKYPEGAFSEPEPAAPEPAAHEACDPGPKPAKHKGAMQICPVAGCPCPTWSGRCKAHARTRSDGKAYATGHRNVTASLMKRWASVRREYLTEHPFCECAECAAVPEPLRPAASEVDHIDGLGLLGPRAFDPVNLQALTKAHHARKTAGESFGH